MVSDCQSFRKRPLPVSASAYVEPVKNLTRLIFKTGTSQKGCKMNKDDAHHPALALKTDRLEEFQIEQRHQVFPPSIAIKLSWL